MCSSILGISSRNLVINMDSPSINGESAESQKQRSCVSCHTTRTPLWRGGPAGPRSVCNACGIRHRKMMRSVVNNGSGRENKRGKREKVEGLLRVRVVGFGREMVMGNQEAERNRGEFGEEERAAVLLMALSCG